MIVWETLKGCDERTITWQRNCHNHHWELLVAHKIFTLACAFVLVSSPIAPDVHNEDPYSLLARLVTGNESSFFTTPLKKFLNDGEFRAVAVSQYALSQWLVCCIHHEITSKMEMVSWHQWEVCRVCLNVIMWLSSSVSLYSRRVPIIYEWRSYHKEIGCEGMDCIFLAQDI
jgi:hypothetical protein